MTRKATFVRLRSYLRLQHSSIAPIICLAVLVFLAGYGGIFATQGHVPSSSDTVSAAVAMTPPATPLPTPQISFIAAHTTATPQPTVSGRSQRVLPAVLIGGNVDMGELLPSSANYVTTTRGDLFDIAHHAGLNAFRVTSYETWGPGQPRHPYHASDWKYLGQRAAADHMYLVPLVELPSGLLQQMAAQAGVRPNLDIYTSALISVTDMILGESGLAHTHTVAMIDIANEVYLSPPMVNVLSKVAAHIHATYPTIPVTVGGWRAPIDPSTVDPMAAFQPATAHGWVYNYPLDGAPAVSFVDVVSVHVYTGARPNHAVYPLFLENQTTITEDTLAYFQQVHTWSRDLPIVMSEFGGPDGILPSRQVPRGVTITADTHATLVNATLKGTVLARQKKINVMGALIWILAPRGGAVAANAGFNAFSVLIPQGSGHPIKVLPGFKALCSGLQGMVPCPKSSTTPEPSPVAVTPVPIVNPTSTPAT